jgi:hypothetical protein
MKQENPTEKNQVLKFFFILSVWLKIIRYFLLLVCPMPSIDYPGTRELEGFFQYSNTRVVGSSTRDPARALKLKIVTAADILSLF